MTGGGVGSSHDTASGSGRPCKEALATQRPLFCQQASSHTDANLRCPHSNFHSQRSSIVFSSSLSIGTTKLSSSPPSPPPPPLPLPSTLPWPSTRLHPALCGCPAIRPRRSQKWTPLFETLSLDTFGRVPVGFCVWCFFYFGLPKRLLTRAPPLPKV